MELRSLVESGSSVDTVADFKPFPSKQYMLLYMLVHGPKPMVMSFTPVLKGYFIVTSVLPYICFHCRGNAT